MSLVKRFLEKQKTPLTPHFSLKFSSNTHRNQLIIYITHIMSTAIEFENISKQYRLGLVSTGTLSHDLNRFWQTKILHREDPYLKVGETNDRAHKGSSEYVWALKDINFKVEQGDVVGIIGRNGAGKSTLLKLLSRVTAPTTGIIRARGRIASLLEVGTGFHPEMTGRENIYMNGAIMGMSRAEITRKLDEIVDFSGCERYLDTPVKRYSSGMTVRLGFAIAAHLEPEILVVDEVLAVGDAEFQKKAIGKMQDVSRGEGRTVLFVSHNMGAVKSLCTRGLVLNNGEIAFQGNIDESIGYYLKYGIVINSNRMSDTIKQKAAFITIDSIKINQSESTQQTIIPNQKTLEIEINGHTLQKFTGNIKLIFKTISNIPLATLAESTYKGELIHFDPGHFSIKRTIKLPKYLNHGSIILDLLLYNKSIHYFHSPYLANMQICGSSESFGQPLNISLEGFAGLETIQ